MKRIRAAHDHTSDPAAEEVLKKSISEMPMRMLGVFSDRQLTLYHIEALLDIINLKFIKGFRKYRKK